ncbi:protein-disulfide reductase DsbD family protein [Gallaecimonas kandeliae]|uniref:protein-disulfide reductase DsbD family protein n=1 Tax=Gallaecimonas kandeliae TaxID=3029055 RepID=UPI0026494508|nr:protein-disulfide reductase DsbD domain-containing protein [Gallaecimonas kandeliae]WKE67032.1 protein-disulfide reductase DsbD family protein [Gallaecimonas kandeliae]
MLRHLLLALLSLCLIPAWAEPVERPHIQVDLKAEVSSFVPGQPFWVAVHFNPEPGWHTYWQNPGDAGAAPKLDWQLPKDWQAGPIRWPIPKAIDLGDIVNYGFEGESSLLVELTPPAGASDTELLVKASWLVCKDSCIPGDALLHLPLKAGAKALPDNSGFFASARARLPKPLDGRGRMEVQQDLVSFALKVPELAGQLPRIFVTSPDLVAASAKPRLIWQGDTLLVSLPKHLLFTEVPDNVRVLLVTPDQALDVGLGGPASPAKAGPPLWLLLAMALAGGLLLNLMPCVFPVLALKAMHLKAGQGWHYLAGVLVSLWVLVLVLWLLRLAGHELGWGFQLQSPWFVALLASLFAAMGLALLAEVQLGTRFMGLGQDQIHQGHPWEAFMTGLLAVLVASPCTAPFMAPAIGIGLTLPLWQLLAVFSALGLGLALPFLLLVQVPALAKRLPRPGPWLASARKLLAFPLLLAAVWLLWVLNSLSGQAFWLLAAWVLGVGLWLLPWRAGRYLAALPLLLVAFWPQPQASSQALAFDEATLKARLAEHRPVLVNMTADWCITCQINERSTLAREEARALFALYDVTYLEGDWTARDPVISRFLASFDRAGVPLYVLYDRQGQPHVLPQLLTPAVLADNLKAILEAEPASAP